jgi:hypothetical protein
MAEHKDGAWRTEVLTFGSTAWATNALRFDSEEEALDYADDLAGRWLMVDKVRAVPVTTPNREPYVEGSEAAR